MPSYLESRNRPEDEAAAPQSLFLEGAALEAISKLLTNGKDDEASQIQRDMDLTFSPPQECRLKTARAMHHHTIGDRDAALRLVEDAKRLVIQESRSGAVGFLVVQSVIEAVYVVQGVDAATELSLRISTLNAESLGTAKAALAISHARAGDFEKAYEMIDTVDVYVDLDIYSIFEECLRHKKLDLAKRCVDALTLPAFQSLANGTVAKALGENGYQREGLLLLQRNGQYIKKIPERSYIARSRSLAAAVGAIAELMGEREGQAAATMTIVKLPSGFDSESWLMLSAYHERKGNAAAAINFCNMAEESARRISNTDVEEKCSIFLKVYQAKVRLLGAEESLETLNGSDTNAVRCYSLIGIARGLLE